MRSKLFLITAAIALTSTGTLMARQKILREVRGERFLIREVLLTELGFSLSAVEETARTVLAEARDLVFVRLRVFGDEASATPLSKPDHTNYDLWRPLYDTCFSQKRLVAEMIATRDGAVVRYHGPDSEVHRKVLNGRDPLFLELRQTRLELLEVAIDSNEYRRSALKEQAMAFFRVDRPLQADVGVAAFKWLRDRLPFPLMGVYLRQDEWFIQQWKFPIVYPFSMETSPPTLTEYVSSATLHCGESRGEIECSSTGGISHPR